MKRHLVHFALTEESFLILPELALKLAPERVETPRSRRESDRSRISRPSAAEDAAEERVEREDLRRLASRSDLSRSRSAAR